MANVQRLTKRVKDLEEWTKENEMTGGPQGILETFAYLVNEARRNAQRTAQTDQAFHQLRQLTFEFVKQHDLTEEWDDFVKEKEEDAVQEQTTEEVPTREAPEDSEEVGEEDSEGSETSKEDSEKKD